MLIFENKCCALTNTLFSFRKFFQAKRFYIRVPYVLPPKIVKLSLILLLCCYIFFWKTHVTFLHLSRYSLLLDSDLRLWTGIDSSIPAKFSRSRACRQSGGHYGLRAVRLLFISLWGRHSAILMRSDTSINTEQEW